MISTKTKGDMAENVCCSFLKRGGFSIIARNYKRAKGEIDIIAIKDGVMHFFEVKSTTVSHLSELKDAHRLEENVHDLKLYRLRHTIRRFLSEIGKNEEDEFHFHVLCAYLNMGERKARIKWIKNVIL